MTPPAADGPAALPAPGPIVVPLDGSPLAEQAVPIAAELARRTGARLHLLIVHEATARVPGDTFDATWDPAWLATTETGQKQYLARWAEALAEDGVHVITATPTGIAAPIILDYIRRVEAALLVMTTHGRGGLSRLWLGSTLDHVLRETPAPILVVRAAETPSRPAPAPAGAFSRVLIALDGSELGETAIEPALVLGAPFGAEYHLVSVVPPAIVIGSPHMAHSVRMDDELMRLRQRQAEDYLARVERRIEEDRGVGVDARVVVSTGDPVQDLLLRTAAELDASLIALATHARGGLERAVLGSVADKVIRAATLPLLVVRPGIDGSSPGERHRSTAGVAHGRSEAHSAH